MPSGMDRLVRQQLDRAAADLPDQPIATVTAITVGGGRSPVGGDLVTVDYLGASLQVPHMAHYTPVVGHVVVLGRVGGTWAILGRLVGFPPT